MPFPDDVANAPPGTYWDTEITGFGLRVLPSLSRSFFLNYWSGRRERRFTIGKFPLWTWRKARAEARRLRECIDKGENPTQQKQDTRDAPTVRELADRYMRDHLPKKSKRTQAEDVRLINREILPALGDRKVASIHFGDMEALHRDIAKRAPIGANRTLSVASRMFSMALKPLAGEEKPWRTSDQGNPCKGIETSPEEGRERFFSARELAAISDALAAYDGKASDCIRFVMLTGCRPSEAAQATWDQVETEPGFWVKPSAHTKQRRVHRVPLTPPALALLSSIERSPGKSDRWIFPGLNGNEPVKQLFHCWDFVRDTASVALWEDAGPEKAQGMIAELRRALSRTPTAQECLSQAKLLGIALPTALLDSRIYDLRHTFASVGASSGLGLPVIGRLLGHTQARTTQRYVHLSDDPLKDAADQITAIIASAGQRKGVTT